jgi:hypothetical protein
MQQSLNDELAEIDEAIAELEDRRTNIISQRSTKISAPGGGGSSIKIQKVNGITANKSGRSASSGKPSSDSGIPSNIVSIASRLKERNI